MAETLDLEVADRVWLAQQTCQTLDLVEHLSADVDGEMVADT